MSTDWNLDFSHDLLHEVMTRMRRHGTLHLLGDAEDALATGAPIAFVRHDVDVSLTRARDLAVVEQAWGLRSTYHVMSRSPFYDLHTPESREAMRAIAGAGHEIGLHFFRRSGEGASDASSDTLAQLEVEIDEECRRLEDLLGSAVRSLSFHIPPPSMTRGPLRVSGRINAYAAPLLGWYLSDSCGRWREGDPRESLDVSASERRSHVLQVLVHPIWWGPEHASPEERLGAWVVEVASATGRSFDEVADLAWDHIIFRAKRPR
jgi:hypothetical protein